MKIREFSGGQWLVVRALLLLQGAWDQSLVWELRSHMPCSAAQREKKKSNNGDMEKSPHGLITLLKKIEGAGFEDGHQKSANIIIT